MAQSSPDVHVTSLPIARSLPLQVAQVIAVLITAAVLIGLTLLLNTFVFNA
ncbi:MULTISPECIES: hypothetical protein [Roseiflexus]|jgi:hypothetical protein|uniref:hypothetical protein n=1 Tax=Roseiflexus TaxID=120961 RepID=UPI000305EF68|nr:MULTISPECIES: hypothetical protein [Roseiflexus]GIW00768.1 MAG: hypothetical protein KatS3mg058_2171 [Roseiflexus sp.]